MASTSMAGMSAMSDLGIGMGDMLSEEQKKQMEEEMRKRRTGLSSLGLNPMNFGMTGVASADLGMGAGGKR